MGLIFHKAPLWTVIFISWICIPTIIFFVKITSREKIVATVLKALYIISDNCQIFLSQGLIKDKSFPIYSITEQLLFLSTYFSTLNLYKLTKILIDVMFIAKILITLHNRLTCSYTQKANNYI